MAETVGEIKPELAEAVRVENLCAALSGHLLVGWWGTRLDPRQKIGAHSLPLFQHSRKFRLPNPRCSQEWRTKWFPQFWQKRFL